MSYHTPEPWDYDADDLTLYSLSDGSELVDLNDRGNVRRIVGCVNACAGIDTEKLGIYPVTLCGLSYVQLEKQRDELLEALKAAAGEVTLGVSPYSTDSYLPQHIRELVASAIAKAEAK